MTKKWPPPGYPIVEGPHVLSRAWGLTLPAPYCRRIEDGSLVLWRPGITVWCNAWNNDNNEPQSVRLAHFKEVMSPDAREVAEEQRGGCARLTYRIKESVETLTALIFSDTGHLQMAVYFDDVADAETAAKIAASVTWRGAV